MAASKTTKVVQQLSDLEGLAETMGVRVSYEPMTGIVSGRGGLCRVRGQFRIIIDRRHKAPERLQILADALGRFDISGHEIPASIVRLLVGSDPERKSA
jgi:hypothetical protein